MTRAQISHIKTKLKQASQVEAKGSWPLTIGSRRGELGGAWATSQQIAILTNEVSPSSWVCQDRAADDSLMSLGLSVFMEAVCWFLNKSSVQLEVETPVVEKVTFFFKKKILLFFNYSCMPFMSTLETMTQAGFHLPCYPTVPIWLSLPFPRWANRGSIFFAGFLQRWVLRTTRRTYWVLVSS